MTVDKRKIFEDVFCRLSGDGLLLLADSSLPSVTTIVTKQKIKGSWWSHPDGQTIYAVSELLEDHPDVLITKLISQKITFVHRELWQTVYSIGIAHDDWQLQRLSTEAKKLLKRLEKAGFLESNKLDISVGAKPGDVVRELEARLLLHAEQVHTSSGAHAKILETWEAWAKRVGFKVRMKDPAAARLSLEERVMRIGAGKPVTLPWSRYL